MKKFRVTIAAYDHYASFEVECLDDPASLENAIVDKLGENSINWEYTGDMYDTRRYKITYEEVINGQPHPGALPKEEGSRQKVGAGT
jgi:hypothetical protein